MAARPVFRAFRLTLPRELDAASVADFLASIGAMKRPIGPYGLPAVGMEVHSDRHGITHTLLTEPHHEDFVLGQLRTFLPGVRVDRLDQLPARLGAAAVGSTVQVGVELRMTHHGRPLRAAPKEIASAVIGALTPLGDDAEVRWQLFISPRQRPKPNIVDRQQVDAGPLLDRERQLIDDAERLRARDQKQREPLLVAIGRVAVSAPSSSSAKQVARRMLAAIRTAEAPGVRLVNRLISSRTVVRRMNRRQVPLLDWGFTLNSFEAAGLLALPYGSLVAPGLSVGSSAQLPPRLEVPTGDEPAAVRIGVSTYPGLEQRTVGLYETDRLLHTWACAPTGTGKSTVLAQIALQDAAAGRGMVVLDPKGDLIAEILARLPAERHHDVIVLDPTDPDRPVGFNPLWVQSTERHVIDRAVDFVVGTLHSLYERTWGPRTEDVLRSACLSLVLASDPDRPYTLCDVAELLIGSKEFRHSVVAKLEDRDLLLFWSWFEHLAAPERLNMLGPSLNKLRAFTLRIAIRSVIGQPKGLDLNDILATGKILLVPLPKGVIGQETAALLGSLLVSATWQATLERASRPPTERPFVSLVLDEFQEFLRVPGDIGDVLTQARGLGTSVLAAHQHLGQLPPELLAAVKANARSKLFFQLNNQDAKVIAPLLGGWLQAEDLENLPVHEAVFVAAVGGQVLPPCTIRTFALSDVVDAEQADRLRAASAIRWGTPIAELTPDRPAPRPATSSPRPRPNSHRRPKANGETTPIRARGKRAPLSGDAS